MEESPEYGSKDATRRVLKGVRYRDVEALGESLHLSLRELSPLIGIPVSTLHRRKKILRFPMEESDRVVRYERLFQEAKKVFGSPDEALGWLRSSQRGLGGATPLEYARTEAGAREVEKLLGRIEYGVYS